MQFHAIVEGYEVEKSGQDTQPIGTREFRDAICCLATNAIIRTTVATKTIWKLEKKLGIPSSRVMLTSRWAAPMEIKSYSLTSASRATKPISTLIRIPNSHR